MIKGLHHSAYRCRDSEETRSFYEDFLGLRLVGSLAIQDSPRSAKADVLHPATNRAREILDGWQEAKLESSS